MDCKVNKKSHFRHLLLFAFKRGQKASEVTKDICAVYGEEAIAERTVRDWSVRFKHGNFDLNDAPCSGRSIKMDKDQLRNLLKEDGHQTCRELSEKMKRDFATISRHLQSMVFTQKLGAWVPHELTQKQKDKRLSIAAQNLARHHGSYGHKQRFLYRIVTRDGKWYLYVNTCMKQRKEWVSPGENPKPRIKKDLL